jgi:thioredoxin-related protein
MKKLVLVVPFLVALITFSFAPTPTPTPAPAEGTGIKWMSLKEAQEAIKKQPKKIFVDVYTDWCGWCKRMDATTFQNPVIVKYVNDNFYAVKFNAESKETFQFNGKEYTYATQGTRGYNTWASEMLSGQLSYPTTVYLDEKLNPIFPVPGYLDPSAFETVLHYVNSDSYKSQKWEDYQGKFKGTIEQK